MRKIPGDLQDWLKEFSAAVRRRDIAAGKNLFASHVVAFGTVADRVNSLDELVARQWQTVWPGTADFDFDYASARAITAAGLATIVAEWKSTGLDGRQQPFPRRGRATIVLQPAADGWQAVHTHFSINPESTHDPVLRHA
jgi:ketosteroid isomerase-like protein